MKHRNLKLWQEVTESCTQVVDRACHLMEDWCSANTTILAASRIYNSTNIPRNDQMITIASVRQDTSGMVQNSSFASTTDMTSVRWKRPQRGRVKCNVEASFSE